MTNFRKHRTFQMEWCWVCVCERETEEVDTVCLLFLLLSMCIECVGGKCGDASFALRNKLLSLQRHMPSKLLHLCVSPDG